jgi:Tfp pilus assembly protein PilN
VPRRINLLPKTERVRTTTNVAALSLLAAGVVVVFALALSFYLLSSERSSLRDDLAALQRQSADLQQQVQALDKYKQLATEKKAMEDTVRGVYAGRTLLSQVLSDFSKVIPENVWLVSMTLSAGEPQTASADKSAPAGTLVSGVGSLAIQGDTYSFSDVALVLVRLRLIASLKDITLNSAGDPIGATDPAKHVVGFSLDATVVNTQAKDTQLPISRVEVEGL